METPGITGQLVPPLTASPSFFFSLPQGAKDGGLRLKRRCVTTIFWWFATGWIYDIYPIPSMYGIFTYIWLIFMVNVGKYTIHGLFGYWYLAISILLLCNTASMKNKSSKYVHNTTITSPQVRVKQNMFFLQTTTKNPSNSWLSDRRFWFSRNTVCPPFIHTSLRWPYLQDLHSIIRMFFFMAFSIGTLPFLQTPKPFGALKWS